MGYSGVSAGAGSGIDLESVISASVAAKKHSCRHQLLNSKVVHKLLFLVWGR